MKKYYPVEFFAAMLTSVMGNNDKVAFYIDCCKRMGMEVLPPDINESSITFTVNGGRIRFGLAAIKNVGKSAIISIIKARKQKGAFVSFTDFCQKVNDGDLNKRAAESLIKAGAFDSLGRYRSQLLAIYEQVMDGIAMDRKRNLDGQISLFDMGTGSTGSMTSSGDIVPRIKEFEKKYLLTMEKEMTGLYLSGHPLAEYSRELDRFTSINTSEIYENTAEGSETVSEEKIDLDNRMVTMGGIISSIKIKATRSGSIMAFITLEDMYGSIEVLVFPKVYEKYNKLIQEDNLTLIKGRISIREDEAPKLLAEDIKPLKRTETDKLYLKVPASRYDEILRTIKPILSSRRGPTPVYIVLDNDKKDVMQANKELWVEISEELLGELCGILGKDSVKVC